MGFLYLITGLEAPFKTYLGNNYLNFGLACDQIEHRANSSFVRRVDKNDIFNEMWPKDYVIALIT